MIKSFNLFFVVINFLIVFLVSADEKSQTLISKVITSVGTIDTLHSLKDVEYTYIVNHSKSNNIEVSTERYIFNGELSWARYEFQSEYTIIDECFI